MRKRKLPTYNDGSVSIYREKRRETSFGAKRNAMTLEDMEPVAKLRFRSMSVREQDFNFAEQIGFACSTKVATHRLDCVKVGDMAVIGGSIYQIGHIDKSQTEMYVYMDGGVSLVDAR